MTGWFLPLLAVAYLLGSVPTSYITARLFYGIDLRQHGTGQVGGGNLWRMTSWKLGMPVGIFDACKGLLMVWIAQLSGCGVSEQVLVGVAAAIGHNWPVFLRFNGGRGLGTVIGIIFILFFVSDITPWITPVFFGILIIGSVILRSSPVPALTGVLSLPVVSTICNEPANVTLALLAIPLVVIIKRITAPLSPEAASISRKRLLLNRLFFDRDISDGKKWMYRQPTTTTKQE